MRKGRKWKELVVCDMRFGGGGEMGGGGVVQRPRSAGGLVKVPL